MVFSWSYTPLAMPLFIGTIVLLIVAALAWRRRHIPGALYMCLVALALAIYSLGYALELGSTDVNFVRLWLKIEYLGSTPANAFGLLMALAFTGRRRFITRVNLSLLMIIPVLTVIFAWSNDWHGLIWQNIFLERPYGYTATQFKTGPWYSVSALYLLVTFSATLLVLAQAWRSALALHRQQIGIILIGMLVPMLTYIAYILNIAPSGLDLNPYAFLVSGVTTAFGMFGIGLFEIVPIARESIFNDLPNAILIFDAQKRLVDINPAGQKLFNLPPGQNIGVNGRELFSRWPDVVERYSGKQEASAIETLILDGVTRHLNVRLSPLRDDRGNPQGLLLLLTDVTSQVEAQSALYSANERLLTLHRVDNELSRKLDVDYVATFALDAAMRMSHADAAVIGFADENEIRILQTLGRYDHNVIGNRIDNVGISGRAIRNRKAERVLDVHSDPDYNSILPGTGAQISAPLLSGKKLIGVITLETQQPERFTTDVFESIQMLASRVAIAIDNARTYEERDELVSELDAFAHTVAHDLKNPLSVITGYAELLKGSHTSMKPEEVDEFLDMIFNRAFKMVSIINSLLLLASVRGLEGVHIEPLEMGAIVGDVLSRLENLTAEKQARIRQPERWPKAMGYAAWAEEIWVNYISNALKYGGDPPDIELGAEEVEGGLIRFSVTDHGPGMTETDRKRLFTPFIRLEADRIKEGHGLGLSIVQRIAVRLGGAVGVESQIGKGSTFFFTLPAEVEQPEPVP
jgi:PAS domain S-box-containing protein